MPATLAGTRGITVLREHGPSILNTTYKDVAAKKELPRLQGPAGSHKSGNDPHIQGRAIDIILFANIVDVFLTVREKMKWLAVVYNKRQWNWAGQEFPRGGDLISQHVTHIHIEWAMAFSATAAWEQDLIDELGNRNWG